MSESEFRQKKCTNKERRGRKQKKKKDKAVPPNNFHMLKPQGKIIACINKLQKLQNFPNTMFLKEKEVYTLKGLIRCVTFLSLVWH